ncbi:FH1/FH2 domain-containing protein 1 isoform X2 [Salarias fasciatus]|uniref:FH1/FH2 domain-containing protein 1 isoform X2 n=1 Tax=Salarias fasciatus TaxID=181472 RepID=UPI001176539E|nr:FH1/FH2 domain-containing protein 1-like isoform X2 [Salarias fasciatus]
MTRFGIQTIWAALEPVHLDTNRLEYLFESKGGSGGYSVLSGRQQPAVSGAGGEAQQHRHHRPQQPAAAPPPPPAILSMDSSVLDREDVQRLSSGDPDRRGDGSDPRGQSPEPPLPPGPGRALPAHAGRHPSPELQAAALGLRSGLRLLGEGDRRASLPSEAGHGAAGGQPHLQVHPGHRAGRRQFPQRCKARVFELSYLGKLSQVRDTHTRQPLLHHVCELLLQLYPQSSDLYSEIPAVTKAGKNVLGAAEGSGESGTTGGEEARGNEPRPRPRRGRFVPGCQRFLKECEERLKVLKAVHRRVINRFHSFLLFLGYSKAMARDTRAEDFCKTISDFSLEYPRRQAGRRPAAAAGAAEGRGREPGARHSRGEQEVAAGSVTGERGAGQTGGGAADAPRPFPGRTSLCRAAGGGRLNSQVHCPGN